ANIDYALSLHHIDKSQRQDIIEDVLRKTGLSRGINAPARLLSFGEQQRLAIARAWALKPQILFLDEPTASLDPSATHQIEELILAMHDQGTKIVMTSHDLGQARRLGDEVLFLHRGRLLEQAPAEAFFERPQNDLAQAFVKGELLWWKRGEGPRHDPKHIR
ncbi:MAG: ATP-binding cassette domain-containing protein, partial [Magnetovibrio sp.]|nr:ATP-binding cassette domain-containing protein [Magnetovibrio sp.]